MLERLELQSVRLHGCLRPCALCHSRPVSADSSRAWGGNLGSGPQAGRTVGRNRIRLQRGGVVTAEGMEEEGSGNSH